MTLVAEQLPTFSITNSTSKTYSISITSGGGPLKLFRDVVVGHGLQVRKS